MVLVSGFFVYMAVVFVHPHPHPRALFALRTEARAVPTGPSGEAGQEGKESPEGGDMLGLIRPSSYAVPLIEKAATFSNR